MIYRIVKPLLFRLEAERAHELVTGLLRAAAGQPAAAGLIRALYAYEDPALATVCCGLRHRNPVGLAAGFDKRGELVGALGLLGFGHVEVGTVTPRPQPGNPQPRLFRLPRDRALINRMGFNGPGMHAVAEAARGWGAGAAGRRARPGAGQPHAPVVGVNIGKNRDTPLERAAEDYALAFEALAPLADYVTVNISSPNTPGLRKLHERAALEELLGALVERNARLSPPRPLFLKISPDERPDALEEVVAVGRTVGCSGFVATNTTVSRDGVRGRAARETGGLSGSPLQAQARETVARIARMTGGETPIIGVGGVASAEDAYAMIRAGASLVQIYTGMVYEGPELVRDIKRGLVSLLWRDGLRSIADAVGIDSRP